MRGARSAQNSPGHDFHEKIHRSTLGRRPSKGRNRCQPYRSVEIEPVSANRLHENGNFCGLGWRLSANSRQGCRFLETRDFVQLHKNPINAVLSTNSGSPSLVERLAGWRRSTDRACLLEKSLRTGNFTGKLAISVPRNVTHNQNALHCSDFRAKSLFQLLGKQSRVAGNYQELIGEIYLEFGANRQISPRPRQNWTYPKSALIQSGHLQVLMIGASNAKLDTRRYAPGSRPNRA